MKLRIKGNTVRIRLTQTEVDQLAKNGVVRESTSFPNGQSLLYAIAVGGSFSATFENNEVSVMLPKAEVIPWASSDQVAMMNELDIEGGSKLIILVEKDFKCLTERPEDEADMFPNPDLKHC